MILGFTGTHFGMAPRQLKAVRQLLFNVKELHLGDCVGADAEAYEEAKRLGIITVGHPPNNARFRAFLSYDKEDEPKPYLKRNWSIVYAGVDGLIAAPKTFVEPTNFRGQGTWTTVRYARQVRRTIWIVRPDGKVTQECMKPFGA